MSWLNLLWMLIVVALASWVLANALIAIFSPLVFKSTHIGIRKHLWVMALLPWVLPLLAILTLLLLALAKSQGWIPHHCETHLAHHPHFCFEHLPVLVLQLSNSAFGVLVVVGALSLLVVRLIPLYQRHLKSQSFQRLISSKALKHTLDDERPLAFTLGGFNPSIFISRGLRKLLTKRHLRIVVRHEIAHARNLDVLKNTLFECLLSIHIWPKLLRAPWYLSSELRADFFVTQKFDTLEIADVLMKLSRVGMKAPFPTSVSGSQLPERVRVLINDAYQQQIPLKIHILYFLVLCFPVALLYSHHSLETLWGWLL